MSAFLVARISELTIRREGTRVLGIANGKLVFDLEWSAAQAIGRAILSQAARAEEEAKALDIVADQALLLRAGVPLLLSDRQDIQQEASKEAAWNHDLRRYIHQNKMGG